ncbi:MAG: hypothetical protein RLP09_04740 [Sandaracinaceae bacterium]
MAAFNYLRFQMQCPHCGQVVEARAQVHVAADFDGDETGRFLNREYRLGEKMRWFSDADELDWIGFCERNPVGALYETTTVTCSLCSAESEVDVEFDSLVATRVVLGADGRLLAAVKARAATT